MFIIIPFKENDNNIYNIKHEINKLQNYITKYKLLNKGIYKDYYKNNCIITLNDIETKTYKIHLKKNYTEDKNLIIELDKELIDNFIFYEIDYEEIYTLYSNIINDVIINIKVYENYFEIEYTIDDLEKFNNYFF